MPNLRPTTTAQSPKWRFFAQSRNSVAYRLRLWLERFEFFVCFFDKANDDLVTTTIIVLLLRRRLLLLLLQAV